MHQYYRGVQELTLDKTSLKNNTLVVMKCKGTFKNGKSFEFPSLTLKSLSLEVPIGIEDQYVLLTHESEGNLKLSVISNFKAESNQMVLAKIKKVDVKRGIELDAGYIPECLSLSANHRLCEILGETKSLIRYRADALSARINNSRVKGADVADFLMLQVLNRVENSLDHISNSSDNHPITFYKLLIALIGELSTFLTESKRPERLPRYQHDELALTFNPLFQLLVSFFSIQLEQRATIIPLVDRKYGIKVASIDDRTVIETCRFLLLVSADTTNEKLRHQFSASTKISAIEDIRRILNSDSQGISLFLLPVAPRQVPYHTGVIYFELDKDSDYWNQIKVTGTLAIHTAGDFPGLRVELWMINDN